jgi:hypothetical protein
MSQQMNKSIGRITTLNTENTKQATALTATYFDRLDIV